MTFTKSHWISKLLDRLQKSDISIGSLQTWQPSIVLLQVEVSNWTRVAVHCKAKESRLASLWGEQYEGVFRINACFEKNGAYIILRTSLDADEPAVGSLTPHYPNAGRLERHCQDLLGIRFDNTTDSRKWTRHYSWSKEEFPLRNESFLPPPGYDDSTRSDQEYEFHSVKGQAVYEIPVGPVHAGIIEPGHFRFHAVGERVINLEERLGYTHKGIEKIASGQDINKVARLAARVSGDSTVAHTWALCQAAEQAASVEIPERGLILRAILLERERVANHLGDIGAICNDVGFAFAQMQFSRLRERWQRTHKQLFGHRLLMDLIIPGGISVDLDKTGCELITTEIKAIREEVYQLFKILRNSQSLRARLVGTGILEQQDAQQLGCLGPVARASGVTFDSRLDLAYAPYNNISLVRPVQKEGDVSARVIQRAEEIYSSLVAIEQLIEKLPYGPVRTTFTAPEKDAESIGIIEGWRGEIITYVRFDSDGKISRFFPRDPSWFNWPALEVLIHGNIVPDFPVCNKSVNGSYSGHDL